jgi:hypothetical protein
MSRGAPHQHYVNKRALAFVFDLRPHDIYLEGINLMRSLSLARFPTAASAWRPERVPKMRRSAAL